MMDPKDLAKLVRRMRQAQRDYFRDRTPSLLAASKALERELDDLIVALLDDETKPALFDGQ